MNFSHYVILLTLTAAALLGGCDSSGPSTPNVPSSAGGTSTLTNGRGSVKITVQFPTVRSRAAGASSAASGTSGVPIGAQSVKIDITDPATSTSLAQSQIVAAPASGTSSVSESFGSIRAGQAHIVASAYNTPDASGPAVGLASTVIVNGAGNPVPNFTVPADGSAVAVTPIITSTAATIRVFVSSVNMGVPGPSAEITPSTPPPQIIIPNSNNYTAMLYDANGVELVGSPLVFSSGNTILLMVQTQSTNDPAQATGTVSITRTGDGAAQVEVRDPNSGITFDFNQDVITD